MATVEDREIQRLQKLEAPSASLLSKELCHAAGKGWTKVALQLLGMGASPNSKHDGRSALVEASKFGNDHVDVVRLLLDNGADPNGPKVMAYCGPASFPVLIEAGGRADGNSGECHPLHVAIAQRTKEDKALLLIEAGANVNAVDNEGNTPLMLAAEQGRIKVFDALVKSEADLSAIDHTGRSILRRAVEKVALDFGTDSQNARSIVRKLRKLLPSQPEDLLLTDLALGDVESMRQRLQNGLDPNTWITGGISVLTISLETFTEHLKKSGGLVEGLASGTLIPSESEADNLVERSSLLMWAVALKEPEIVELLLEYGADPNLQNRDGISAAIMSARCHDERIRQRLGTLNVFGRERVPRGTKIEPTKEDWATAGSRAKRLGIVEERLKQSEQQSNDLCSKIADWAKANQYLDGWVGEAWERISILHCLERLGEMNAAMDFTYQLTHNLFFGNWRSQVAHRSQKSQPFEAAWRREVRWVTPFVDGCAVAAAREQWDDVAQLCSYPQQDCCREVCNSFYSHAWHDWPFWMLFVHDFRKERVDEKPLRDAIEKEKGKRAKLMIAAYDAIRESNAKSFLKAFGKLVTWHRDYVLKKYDTPQGGDILSAEATLLWATAIHRGLDVAFDEAWADFVLRPAS